MSWENIVRTGNPQADWQQAMAMKQQAESQGMRVDVQTLPQGGVRVVTSPAQHVGMPQPYGAPASPAMQMHQQQPYGAPPSPPHQMQQAQPSFGQAPAMQQQYGAPPMPQQPQHAWAPPPMHGGAAVMGPMPGAPMMGFAPSEVVQPEASMGEARIQYLRKVYGYLLGASTVGIAAGWATLNFGPTTAIQTQSGVLQVPALVALMLQNRLVDLAVFGVLLVAISVASAVSKVRGINVAALFGVAAVMGIEFAPMVWLANFAAGLGGTLTADPVRDSFAMTAAVFFGATGYVFVAKKDFSYLKATLSMGAIVVFCACILSFFLRSEAFTLAVCSVGAIVASGLILYQTSNIFRSSDMDDPVEDALGLLIQLRNLLMFLMRIFMSRR